MAAFIITNLSISQQKIELWQLLSPQNLPYLEKMINFAQN